MLRYGRGYREGRRGGSRLQTRLIDAIGFLLEVIEPGGTMRRRVQRQTLRGLFVKGTDLGIRSTMPCR